MNYTDQIERLRRKIKQHWELAGLSRVDGDEKDAAENTKKARELTQELSELVNS